MTGVARIQGGTMRGFFLFLILVCTTIQGSEIWNSSSPVVYRRDEVLKTAYSLCQGLFILASASFFIISRICVIVRDMNQRPVGENVRLLTVRLCLLLLILCNMVIFLVKLSNVLTN